MPFKPDGLSLYPEVKIIEVEIPRGRIGLN